MRFSNRTTVGASSSGSFQGDKSVEWQSQLLSHTSLPADEPVARFSERHVSSGGLVHRQATSLEGTIVDEITGAALTVHEPRSSAHVLTVQGASIGQPMSTSLALSTDALEDVTDIYLRQAQAYVDEKQWKKAFQACQEVLKVAPMSAEAYKLLGKVLQQQGKLTDAMGFYAKALTLQPRFPEVYNNLGSLYARKQQWENAITYYQKAVEQDAEFAIAYFNLAKVWRKLRDADRENNCMVAALKLQPSLGSADQHYRLAQTFEESGDKKSAIEFYRQVVVLDSRRVEVHQRLADLLEDVGDWQGAAACYRQVLALNAETETAQLRPQPALNPGKTESVNSPPRVTLAENQLEPKVLPLTQLSSDQLTSGQLTQQNAVKTVSESSAIRQQTSPERVIGQLSEANQRKLQQLLQMSSRRELIQPVPSAPDDKSAADGESQAEGRADSLAGVATETAGWSPVELAQYHAQAKDWPRAVYAFQQAIRQSPKSAALYRGLANSFEKNEQPTQAAEAWYRSFVLAPDWPTAEQCYALGRVLQRQGKEEAATFCFRQAVDKQPDFVPARDALANALSLSTSSQVSLPDTEKK